MNIYFNINLQPAEHFSIFSIICRSMKNQIDECSLYLVCLIGILRRIIIYIVTLKYI